ncbi:MAG: M4 family metallopeptidase [Saprospiraceae bacterium]
MKKSNFTLPFFILSALLVFGFQIKENQFNNSDRELPFTKIGDTQFYRMNDDAHFTAQDFLRKHHQLLGLTENQSWVNYRTETDQLGMTHSRYQLHYDGIPVEGAELLLHEADGRIKHFNGRWPEVMTPETSVNITAEEAIAKALEYIPSEKYTWDDAASEELLKKVHNDPTATAYPQPELVLFNNEFPVTRGEFKAAYKMTVTAYEPQTRSEVYIDASTGALVDRLELHHHISTPGEAETKYHGLRPIITDSLPNGQFRLFDETRGPGVHTLNLENNDNINAAVEFFDDDNYWNNVNANQNEAATDAHFSAEMTYDFYHEHLGHSSVDGNNQMQMISLVHFGDNILNAFFYGSWCTLGYGNGSSVTPLTSLDVVSHEFTHGVTDNTADLRYRNESGALNESFSDIFGTAVEFWAEGSDGDYLIGEDFHANPGEQFRDMSNPNAEDHPDTYLGNDWEFSAADNGGVHTNSGVQNHWFYLLTEGGSGTNDNGDAFNVEPVGMDTSTLIAYRNLKFYLVRLSQYEDARVGALTAAEDLYGPCSYAAIQTENAWQAVGVGAPIEDNDLELISIDNLEEFNCGLTDQEFPAITMRYHDCFSNIPENGQIPLEIVVDNGAIQYDTIIVADGMIGGDTIEYVIDTPISGLETMGFHDIDISVALPNDSVPSNNTVTFTLENVLDQNSDFQGDQILKPDPVCFMNEAPVEIEVTFLGCDMISAGQELSFSYEFKGNVVTESYTLPSSYLRGQTLSYTFNEPIDASQDLGISDISAWVEHPDDAIIFNDSTVAKVVNPENLMVNVLLTFDEISTTIDSFYFTTTDYSDAFLSDLADFQSVNGVFMTGKDPQELLNNNQIVVPTTPQAVWQLNDEFSAMTCICANTQSYGSLDLSFDLRQVQSGFYSDAFGIASPYSSAMRILINGTQASETYFTEQPTGQWDRKSLDISDFAGEQLEICFESRCAASIENWTPGDRVYIDNVLLSGVVSTNNVFKNDLNLSVSPNPSNGLFILNYNNTSTDDLQLQIIDVHGRTLMSEELTGIKGAGNHSLDLNNLSEGVYFLKVGNDDGFVHETLIVTK